MSDLGQRRKWRRLHATSALPPTTDISRVLRRRSAKHIVPIKIDDLFQGITLPRCHHLGARRGSTRGSDLLWRLGKMERRYESARGCRGSSSPNPLIIVRCEVKQSPLGKLVCVLRKANLTATGADLQCIAERDALVKTRAGSRPLTQH